MFIILLSVEGIIPQNSVPWKYVNNRHLKNGEVCEKKCKGNRFLNLYV